MPKLLIHIVAVILTTCLITNSAFAFGFPGQSTLRVPQNETLTAQFRQEALSEGVLNAVKYIFELPKLSASVHRRAYQAGFLSVSGNDVRKASKFAFLVALPSYIAAYFYFALTENWFITETGQNLLAYQVISTPMDFISASWDALSHLMFQGWRLPQHPEIFSGLTTSNIALSITSAILLGVVAISGFLWLGPSIFHIKQWRIQRREAKSARRENNWIAVLDAPAQPAAIVGTTVGTETLGQILLHWDELSEISRERLFVSAIRSPDQYVAHQALRLIVRDDHDGRAQLSAAIIRAGLRAALTSQENTILSITWGFLSKWRRLSPDIRAAVLPEHLKHGLAAGDTAASTVWGFFNSNWNDIPSSLKNVVTPEELNKGLGHPDGEASWQAWVFLKERWPVLSEPLRGALTEQVLLHGINNPFNATAWTAVEFLGKHFGSLSSELQQSVTSKFADVLDNPDPIVLERAWDFLGTNWIHLPESMRAIVTPVRVSVALANEGSYTIGNEDEVRSVAKSAWNVIQHNWDHLPEPVVRSGFVYAMLSPMPEVAKAAEDFEATLGPGIRADVEKAKLLKRNNILPLPNLVMSDLSLDDLRKEITKIQEGGFDISNPVHVDLNYNLLRDEITQQRALSPKESYISFLQMVQDVRQGKYVVGDQAVEAQHNLQIRGMVYEAYLLRRKILAIQERAKQLNRRVVVVENLSYGAVVTSPITEERQGVKFIAGTDIPVWSTKIGSTESHNNEFILRPDLFPPGQMRELMDDQPIVIVVDASTSVSDPARTSPHIPDGFKGYRTEAIAINAALGLESDPGSFLVSNAFIRKLKDTSAFQEIIRTYRRTVRNAESYKFYFYYPGQKTLFLREGKKINQLAPKLENEAAIKGPAFIFIQAAIEPEAVPANVQRDFVGGPHSAAFFDDRDNYKMFFMDYEEGYGFHLSRSYVLRSRAVYRDLLAFQGERVSDDRSLVAAAPVDRDIETVVLDLDGTLVKTDQPLSPRAVQVLRSLRMQGKRIIIATDDIEANVDQRVRVLVDQLSKANPSLLSDLWFATDGGTYIYRYSSSGQKVVDDQYNEETRYSATERSAVLDLLQANVAGQFAIDQRPNRVGMNRRIDLRNVQNRDKFIERVQKALAQDRLHYQIYKAGRTSVKIVKRHKAEAIAHINGLAGSQEAKMLIVADSARTYQIDRQLLSRFVASVSINVGKASRSIGRSNPNIVQTEMGIDGALSVLESLARYGKLPMRPLLPFQNVFTEPSGKGSDYDSPDTRKAAAWSLNIDYLQNWAHNVETRWLIPIMSMAFVFAPLVDGMPSFSLVGAALIIGLAFVIPHRDRMLNPNILLLGAGTVAASGVFMQSLQNFLSMSATSSPIQILFAVAQMFAAIASVEILTRLHWHNNNILPLTQVLLQAA